MADTLRVDTFLADGTWTCPAGVTSAIVECWGAGGGGTGYVYGGGGGAYSKKTVSVTGGNSYSIQVGVSAADTDGEDSTFDSTSVVAKGGSSGTNGGIGGQATASTGDTKYSGGDGSTSATMGYGGGAAGDSEDGDDAVAGVDAGAGGENNGARGGLANIGYAPGGGGGFNTTTSAWGGRGEVRITYQISVASGYPIVKSRSWGRDTAGDATSHAITLPAGISVGDLIIILYGIDANPTCSIDAGDWTKLDQRSYSTTVSQALFYKIAEGSDSATITTSTSQQGSYVVYVIQGGSDIEKSYIANAGTDVNPAALTPTGGEAKYLWIVSCVWDANTFHDISAFPSGYNSLVIQPPVNNSGGTKNIVCEKMSESDSEDPGAFTSVTEQYVCFTVSIYGTAASAGTKPQVNIGDTWKQSTAVQIQVGDTWKSVTGMKVNVGDTWKTIF